MAKKILKLGLVAIIALVIFTGYKKAMAARNVIDYERGSMYTNAFNNDWSHFGASVNTGIDKMKAEAIKVIHGRMHHFSFFDDGQDAVFPFNKLKAFETDEVAAGRNPLLAPETNQ